MHENRENTRNTRFRGILCAMGLLTAIVLATLAWVHPEIPVEKLLAVHDSDSQPTQGKDIETRRDFEMEAFAASWDPRKLQGEMRQVVIRDAVREVLSRYPKRLAEEDSDRLADLLVEEGQRVGIDPLFLAAVIRIESAFSTDAVSHVGARGLMQVMPATGEEVAGKMGIVWEGPSQLHVPEINVRLGVFYLDWLLNRYQGSYKFALTAYNRGPHNVHAILVRDGFLGRQFTGYFESIQQTYEAYLKNLPEHHAAFLQSS